MSLSREEFLRLLPAAVGVHAVDAEGGMCGSDGSRSWIIRLVPLEARRLGSVELDRHLVEIHLEGYSPEQATAFLDRFHRGFQRGGG